jgi:hypothetical protein
MLRFLSLIRDSAARLPLNAPLKTLPPDGKA